MSLAWGPKQNEHTIESVDRVLTSEGLMPAISYLEADLKKFSVSTKDGQAGGVHSCFATSASAEERSGSNARGPLLFWISLGLGIVLLAGYMLWRVM
jgi:hypothetical protein